MSHNSINPNTRVQKGKPPTGPNTCVKLYRYWNVEMQLQKQRVEGRYVTRLIQELRMKGGSFELGKDP
ncbi:hypothetical protein LINPERHAP1_LOCUS36473 [Linum perenne]